jgi:hypothetical protein
MKEIINILCFNRMVRMDYDDEEKKALYGAGIILGIIVLVAIYIGEL